MGKTIYRRGPRSAVVSILCEWCGKIRKTTRQDTRTCGATCRRRLSVFSRRFGYPPDAIPGAIKAQAAIDAEIRRLIAREVLNRKIAAEVRQAYADQAKA